MTVNMDAHGTVELDSERRREREGGREREKKRDVVYCLALFPPLVL